MKNKFNIGDRVEVVENDLLSSTNLEGKKGTIIKISDVGAGIEFDENVDGHSCVFMTDCIEGHDNRAKKGHGWFVLLESLKKIEETQKVIFEGKTTTLLKDGKKYVAKCGDGDTYDKEKGLLICLAKANGITFKDLQEMLDNAETHTNDAKEPLHARFAIGDIVVCKDTGKGYTTYKDWFKKRAPKLLKKYVGYGLKKENEYKIVAVGDHDFHNKVLYALQDLKGKIYLIGEEGIELAWGAVWLLNKK